MMNKYKIRDLPLSFEDGCLLEEASETKSLRTIRPLLQRYLILPDGQTLADVPLDDLSTIITAIMERNGIHTHALKT